MKGSVSGTRIARGWTAGLIAIAALAALTLAPPSVHAAGTGTTAASPAPLHTKDLYVTTKDVPGAPSVKLHAILGYYGSSVQGRPLIIEDGPYSQAVDPFAGSAYNYIELQWRGTGSSTGALSTTGFPDQSDLSQFDTWACNQDFSNGHIGLYGFSASAIVVYNAMHLPLPCVDAASLQAGTVDLYRDLLYIGGIFNNVPGAYVEAAIAGPTLTTVPQRLFSDPQSIPPAGEGYVQPVPTFVLQHQTEDSFWRQRTLNQDITSVGANSDVNHIPILADTGFYDVEARGPFHTYRDTKADGSHLLVIGAHDGFAGGTGGAFPHYTAWFDHYVRGMDNGVEQQPRVSVYLSQGSHARLVSGHYTHLTGTDWPLPGTRWTRLYLTPQKTGTSNSLNDGTLSLKPVKTQAVQSYPFVPSDPIAADEHTTSTLSGAGAYGLSIDGLAQKVPALTDMTVPELSALTYTTPAFTKATDVVGPASLDVFASSTQSVTDLFAVVADVWPDGTAHAVATGQLRTAYPNVLRAHSLIDAQGDIVDPYGDFSAKDPASPMTTREYHVEMPPIGNTFEPGHRLRLYLLGTSAAQLPALPGVDSVSIGGVTPSRLLIPTVGAPFSATLGTTNAATPNGGKTNAATRSGAEGDSARSAGSSGALAFTGATPLLPAGAAFLIFAAAAISLYRRRARHDAD